MREKKTKKRKDIQTESLTMRDLRLPKVSLGNGGECEHESHEARMT
jgi:hypothetical protein